MREKLISKTYLRDVNRYKLEIYYDKEDYYLSIKKILNIEKPFILENGLCLIDNNYYIVEVLPKNENYAMRVYFNEKKERLEYYFDISLKNGLDEETRIPYYDDLYTDITVVQKNIEVLDEEELEEALNMGKISKAEYNIANETRDKLIQSIKNKNNKYMNLNLERYLR
jgi:predicted RNA-binding protein associated with RNAse of E/G family